MSDFRTLSSHTNNLSIFYSYFDCDPINEYNLTVAVVGLFLTRVCTFKCIFFFVLNNSLRLIHTTCTLAVKFVAGLWNRVYHVCTLYV